MAYAKTYKHLLLIALLLLLRPLSAIGSNGFAQALEEVEHCIERARQKGNKIALIEGQMEKARLLLRHSMLDEAIISSHLALLTANEVKREKISERVYRLLSECYMGKRLYYESLEFLYDGCELATILRDTSAMAWYLTAISQNEEYLGRPSNAIAVNIKAIDLFQRIGDTHRLAQIYRAQGVAHSELANYSVADNYISIAIDMLESQADTQNLGIAMMNYASLHLLNNNIVRAQNLLNSAKTMLQSHPWANLRAQTLQANIEMQRGRSAEAIAMLEPIAAQQASAGDASGQASTLCLLGQAYVKQRNLAQATQNFERCLKLAHRENLVQYIRQAHRELAQIYGRNNSYKEAYRYMRQYVAITDSLFNLQSIGEVNRLETQSVINDKEEQLAKQRQLIEANNAIIKHERQKHIYLYIVILLSLGTITYVVWVYRRQIRQTKALDQANAEIENQNVRLAQQNRDIKDSQNYAKRIQRAMLRSSALITEAFPDSFLMFRPRELVSGDFYWCKRIDNLMLFAVADCTGHGTPGAFMSIIGTLGLNQVVAEFNERRPAEVLTRINDLFCHAFEQQAGNEILDGMDIGMCCYNTDTRELQFAGANIGLYLLRDAAATPATSAMVMQKDNYALYHTKFDRQSIGYNFDQRKSYSTHGIQLLPGDCLYLLSDGLIDQFGGPKGKKLGQNGVRKLFCDVAALPMADQQQRIEQTLNAWQGNYMQVDDITVMGIRIP